MNSYTDKTISTNPVDSLTKREKEILVLIAQGLTDKEIADIIFLSPLTVITHRKNILSKLGLKNKVEIARFAMENNLIS
jgi:DNA-binding CsgD family transcriptional regulator